MNITGVIFVVSDSAILLSKNPIFLRRSSPRNLQTSIKFKYFCDALLPVALLYKGIFIMQRFILNET